MTNQRRPALIFSLLLCAVLGAGFSLDRPRHTDLGGLGWSAAFSRLCGLLAREYPFGAWKGIDWTAIERELGPRVADAEARHDRRAWYRALRELVWSLRDGHAHLLGDDGGLERAEVGGSFGLEVVELDDGRVLAGRIAAAGPAARAGLRCGAEIVRWNGVAAARALAAAPVLWSERPPATREGARLEQARLLGRAPVGTRATVSFRDPRAAADGGAGATVETRELVAVAAPRDQPPCLRAAELLFGRTLETRTLAAETAGAAGAPGVGYVRIRFELPTLRTPFPEHKLRRALARFAADRLPGVIVDVRGNCGGLDAMVPPLVAPLLREAMFYEMPGIYRPEGRQDRDRGADKFEPDPRQAITVLPRPPLYRGRIAVLIDGDTVSAGEAVPLLLKGLPGVAVIGLHATHGSFGIGLKSVRMPGGLEVIFPHAQSLDAGGTVEVDADAAGRGGVEPDLRVPLTAAAVERWYGRGDDVVLEEGVRFVREGAAGSVRR
ncbi:MAG TPA: S41 family peptidase [Thermoanaerobaculia bacterium]|nr:S41 family peptidase [Thermoanaerobaculia bacterium]